MTATITTTQRLTVIKHLASGKTPDVVATITHLDRSTVVDIGAHHGYPDKDKLAWAADILAKKAEEETTKELMPQGRPDPVRPAPGSSTSNPAGQPTVTPLTKPDELRILLNTAKAHPSKRIQAAANKVFDDLAKLRTLIAEDAEKNAERRKVEADKAAARAEVDRLKRELAEAQAKLRGTTITAASTSKPDTDDGPTAKEIRVWATAAGVDCPPIGRVPGSVRDAYLEANAQVAS